MSVYPGILSTEVALTVLIHTALEMGAKSVSIIVWESNENGGLLIPN